MLRNQEQITIWDLDNCLSDDRARIRLIDWESTNMYTRYLKYHDACAQDPLRNEDVFHAVTQLGRPVFFTGRPESVRALTLQWIRCELDVQQPLVMMRPNDCHAPSVVVKETMLKAYAAHMIEKFGKLPPCAGAFDDRGDIVDMYRSYGVPAALLSIHSVCAYTAPKAKS